MREKIQNKLLGVFIGMLMIAVTVSANENIDTFNSVIFNNPPIADPGGPYVGIEGAEIIFDGSNSLDPDGDILTYRWYIGPDETPDTDWSLDPFLHYTFGDDFNDYVWVEVSDGTLTDAAKTPTFIENAIPEIDAGPDQISNEGEKVDFGFSFVEPGFNDNLIIYFASNIKNVSGDKKPPKAWIPPGSWYWVEDDYMITDYYINTSDMKVNDLHFENPNPHINTFDVVDKPDDWEIKKEGQWTNLSTKNTAQPNTILQFQLKLDPQLANWRFWIYVHITKDGIEIARDTIYIPGTTHLSYNSISSNSQLNFTYSDSGTYIALFTIIDDDGGSSNDTCTVNVSNLAPAIQPFGPFKGEPGDTFEISATATDKGSDDLIFTWDFGDGSSTITNVYYNNGESPDPDMGALGGTAPFTRTDTVEHTYEGKKIFTITLTVEDDEGAQSKYTTTASTPKIRSVNILWFLYKAIIECFPMFEKILNQYYN